MKESSAEFLESINHQGVSAKGARRIGQIVAAGSDILLERGLWAVTKRRIGNALGISDGNVGYYFPTRRSLWTAVVRYELSEYYRRHSPPSAVDETNALEHFDKYISRYVGEYEDRFVRIFFSQILTVAEVSETVADLRDEIYEQILGQTIRMARPLVPDISEEELESRALMIMSLLEGLHAVSAFRPETLGESHDFRRRVFDQVHGIVTGSCELAFSPA